MKESEKKAGFECVQGAIDQGNIDFGGKCEKLESNNVTDKSIKVEDYIKTMNKKYK